MTTEKEKQLLEAIADFKSANPNARELQETVFTGYLLNCSTGAGDLTEDVVLFNRTLLDLLKTIN